jgi:hypothetical protein
LDAANICSLDTNCPDGTVHQDDGGRTECYSPTSNLSSVYQPGAVSCACDPVVDHPVCAQSSIGSIGMSCEGGHWIAGPDGPCMPGPDGGFPRDTAADSGATTLDAGRTCSIDTDCSAGTVCELGSGCSEPRVCVPGCHLDSQCAAGACDIFNCFTFPCPGRCQ